MRVVISGASGKMGRALIAFLLNTDSVYTLVGALDHRDSPYIGQDAGQFLGHQTGVTIQSHLDILSQADCLIDFTRPEASIEYLHYCEKVGCAMVIGTTGFNAQDVALIEKASQSIGIVHAPNMSIGVNAVMQLLAQAASLFNHGYDCEIYEAHHRNKVDAPSGTAIKMGQVIAQTWGKDIHDIADWSRYGHTGVREDGHIGFSVVRGGDIVGDHRVMFCGQGERIELSHQSSSRESYARGAFLACRFLESHQKGLFNMQDVISSRV